MAAKDAVIHIPSSSTIPLLRTSSLIPSITTSATTTIYGTPLSNTNNNNRSQLYSLSSLLAYSTCSISLTLLNKAIVYSYGMDQAISLILFLQLSTGILCTIAFKHCSASGYFPPLNWRVAKRFLPLALANVVMLQSSLFAFSKVSVPLFNSLKNLSTVLTCLGESFVLPRLLALSSPGGGNDSLSLSWTQQAHYSVEVYMSFLIMTIGSLLAAIENFVFTPMGLLFTMINIVFSSLYLLYNKYLLQDRRLEHLGKVGPSLYSSLVSIPILLVVIIINGEYRVERWYNERSAPLFQTWTGCLSLLLLLLLGGFMPFVVTFCIKNNSCTTYSMVGSLNKIPLAVFGMFLFSQYPSRFGWASVAIGLMGGVLYSYVSASSSKISIRKTRRAAWISVAASLLLCVIVVFI